MRRPRTLGVAAVLTLAAAGAVSAKDVGRSAGRQPISPQAGRALAREQRVIDLVNRAERDVSRRRRECGPPSPPAAATFSHDTPDAGLLAAIGALRRPATPEDVLKFGTRGLEHLPASDVFVDFSRVLHGPDGRDFTLIVARDRFLYKGQPPACRRAAKARIRVLSRGGPASLRRRALNLADHVQRGPKPSQRPAGAIFLFDGAPSQGIGGGGGGSSLAYFLEHGSFGGRDNPGGALLTGLLPNGVARVVLHYPRTVSRGRYLKPKVYPRGLTRTATVRDNVISIKIPRDAANAFPATMTWLAADGSVVRRVGSG